jgi:hypothetical protein
MATRHQINEIEFCPLLLAFFLPAGPDLLGCRKFSKGRGSLLPNLLLDVILLRVQRIFAFDSLATFFWGL